MFSFDELILAQRLQGRASDRALWIGRWKLDHLENFPMAARLLLLVSSSKRDWTDKEERTSLETDTVF